MGYNNICSETLPSFQCSTFSTTPPGRRRRRRRRYLLYNRSPPRTLNAPPPRRCLGFDGLKPVGRVDVARPLQDHRQSRPPQLLLGTLVGGASILSRGGAYRCRNTITNKQVTWRLSTEYGRSRAYEKRALFAPVSRPFCSKLPKYVLVSRACVAGREVNVLVASRHVYARVSYCCM